MIYNVAPEIEKYFLQRYEKQDMRVVPGHWPPMKTKEDIDSWIDELETIRKVSECFGRGAE